MGKIYASATGDPSLDRDAGYIISCEQDVSFHAKVGNGANNTCDYFTPYLVERNEFTNYVVFTAWIGSDIAERIFMIKDVNNGKEVSETAVAVNYMYMKSDDFAQRLELLNKMAFDKLMTNATDHFGPEIFTKSSETLCRIEFAETCGYLRGTR